jgi:hypothetical protein
MPGLPGPAGTCFAAGSWEEVGGRRAGAPISASLPLPPLLSAACRSRCLQALAIDPCFLKALHRRARAAAGAGDLGMAVEDMEVGVTASRRPAGASWVLQPVQWWPDLAPPRGFADPGGSLQGCLLRRLADTCPLANSCPVHTPHVQLSAAAGAGTGAAQRQDSGARAC